MPLILYKLSPPEVKRFAKIEKLSNKSGDISAKISKGEWITIFVFAGMLFFWVFGDKFGLSITLVALGGLCILLLTRVLSIDDVLGARDIWSIFIWLSILNIMAEKLVEYGLIQHYALVLNQKLVGLSWGVVLVFVSLIYYFARYLIPGNVLHACAMFLAIANVLIGCGVPPKIGCMTLAMITAFCGFVTPYANSSSPLYMNTGYIEQKLWWRIGFITSFIYLFIYFVIGAAWWKFLGYW
jgi:DASS family divalent anion:Na+ symporter